MNPPSLRELCAKATPGPYRIARISSNAVENTSRTLVASTGGRTDNRIDPDVLKTELDANAQLIARLSPEVMVKVYEAIHHALDDRLLAPSSMHKLNSAIALLDGLGGAT